MECTRNSGSGSSSPSSMKAIEGRCPPVTLQLLEATAILTAEATRRTASACHRRPTQKAGTSSVPTARPRPRPRPSPYGLFSACPPNQPGNPASIAIEMLWVERVSIASHRLSSRDEGRTVVLCSALRCVVRRVGDNDRPPPPLSPPPPPPPRYM